MALSDWEVILERAVVMWRTKSLLWCNCLILLWCNTVFASTTQLQEKFDVELPCIELEEDCINELQQLATVHNTAINEVNQQLEQVKEQIEVARRNNRRAIVWEQLSPFIRFYLEDRDINLPTNRLERSLGNVPFPLRLLNNALSLIGVPFLQNIFGGSSASQQRAIALNDLETKVIQLERDNEVLQQTIKDKITLELINLNQGIKEWELSEQIAEREQMRMEIVSITYQFGEGDTSSYLNQLSSLDRTNATVERNRTSVHSQLTKLHQLIFN